MGKKPQKKVALPKVPAKFKHATIFELSVGPTTAERFATLFSDSQKCCDLVNHDAMDKWKGFESAYEFARRWVEEDGTIFLSFLVKGERANGHWIKKANDSFLDADNLVSRMLLPREESKKRPK